MECLHWIRFGLLFLLLVPGGGSSLFGQYAVPERLPTEIEPKTTTKVYRAYCYLRNPITGQEVTQESCEVWFYNGPVMMSARVAHFHDNPGRTKGQSSPTSEEVKRNPNARADSISLLSSNSLRDEYDSLNNADARVGRYTNFEGLPYQIKTSQVGQKEWITGCNGRRLPWNRRNCRGHNFTVTYSGLSDYRPTIKANPTLMTDIGWRGKPHTANHYGTRTLRDAITAIARDYRKEFGCYRKTKERLGFQPIGINDMALPYGGVFDIGRNWRGPHWTHHKGNSVDIRCSRHHTENSVIFDSDFRVINRFLELCDKHGLESKGHHGRGTTNEHCHCATSSTGD